MSEYVRRPGHCRVLGSRRGLARVLIVDRDIETAQIFALLLRAHGYDVRVECDCSNGLRVAKSYRPQVVIIDLGSDTMDTYEIAARLRAMLCRQEVYLVSLSACVVPAAYPIGEARFDAYLTKPTGYGLLIGMLERFFASTE